MIGIGIVGGSGRMGRAIAAELSGSDEAYVAGAAERGHDLSGLAAAADVLIDFSTPAALPNALAAAIEHSRPIVIGTTGLGPDDHRTVSSAAETVPVLQAANMSLGIALLAHLVEQAAARLGPDWDVEIVEFHHRHKIDAPSGTALLLGAAAARGRGITLATHSERGRDGTTGPRAAGAIGFASLRGGSVAGDHQVVMAAEGERIELGHRAESRAIFARGAVRAALWLHSRRPGLYGMTDVLGLT